jgi:hypothetical protein
VCEAEGAGLEKGVMNGEIVNENNRVRSKVDAVVGKATAVNVTIGLQCYRRCER